MGASCQEQVGRAAGMGRGGVVSWGWGCLIPLLVRSWSSLLHFINSLVWFPPRVLTFPPYGSVKQEPQVPETAS